MQTALVHARRPHRLWNDLGVSGFFTFQLVLAGTTLTALVQPFVLFWALMAIGTGAFLQAGDTPAMQVLAWMHGAALFGGYAASGVLALIGLKRRRLLAAAWVLAFVPVHWALLSVAAWRALFQLLADPYRWEKTEHGLARTSRRSPDSPIDSRGGSLER